MVTLLRAPAPDGCQPVEMRKDWTGDAWKRLSETPGIPAEHFDPATSTDLPGPASRLLRHSVPAGAALTMAVGIEMTGEIRIGGRWRRFRAEQVLRAGMGFVWRAVVGGPVLRFTGADILTPDEARMDFRLHGLVPVARSAGADTARSAAGRLAAETVAWLPQALTPQAGARWSAIDDDRARVALRASSETVTVEVGVDPSGQLRSLELERWNAAAEPPAFEPFGGEVTAGLLTTDGVRIAGAGRVGWGWGTAQAAEGEFFRYTITAARPVP